MTHLLIKRLTFCLISASILAVSVAAQEQRSPVKGAPRSEMSTKRLHPKKAPQQLRSQPAPVHKPSNSTVVYSAGDIVIYGTYTKGYKGGFCHFGSTDAKTSWTSDYESYSSVFNTGTWMTANITPLPSMRTMTMCHSSQSGILKATGRFRQNRPPNPIAPTTSPTTPRPTRFSVSSTISAHRNLSSAP